MDEQLAAIAQEALRVTGSASAVIFLLDPAGNLHLAAVAGLDGAPLANLIEAVKAPNHPIARTAHESRAEFDVRPMAPGGPALRSHAPLMATGGSLAIGVLALAHQEPLNESQRQATLDLAERAARASQA